MTLSLNPGPRNNIQSLDSNEWNIFKSKGLHLIHLSINSLLPWFDELRYITNSSNATVIGLFKSKLDESALRLETHLVKTEPKTVEELLVISKVI